LLKNLERSATLCVLAVVTEAWQRLTADQREAILKIVHQP
jgi:hypothetical protein